jgi:hypothetical protein
LLKNDNAMSRNAALRGAIPLLIRLYNGLLSTIRVLPIVAVGGLITWVGACGQGTKSQPVTYPDAGSPEAALYVSKCSVCHTAPRPNQHKKTIWPGVLNRMQMRMQSKAIAPMTKGEMQTILEYLQRHANDAQ